MPLKALSVLRSLLCAFVIGTPLGEDAPLAELE
jgi:hypothetical protein